MIEPLRHFTLGRSKLARHLEQRESPSSELPIHTEDKYPERQVVLVGYGRVGRRIANALERYNIPYVVVEQRGEQIIEDLCKHGTPAVFGDAADPAVLVQAHISSASMLVIATPDPVVVRQVASIARQLNPDIEIVLRTHNEDESIQSSQEGFGTVFFGEEELAKGMINHVVARFQTP